MDKNTKKQFINTEVIRNNSKQDLFELQQIDHKPVIASFSAEKISTYGGLLLLRELEKQIGIIGSLTNCIINN